jgi:hypothetical protein
MVDGNVHQNGTFNGSITAYEQKPDKTTGNPIVFFTSPIIIYADGVKYTLRTIDPSLRRLRILSPALNRQYPIESPPLSAEVHVEKESMLAYIAERNRKEFAGKTLSFDPPEIPVGLQREVQREVGQIGPVSAPSPIEQLADAKETKPEKPIISTNPTLRSNQVIKRPPQEGKRKGVYRTSDKKPDSTYGIDPRTIRT